MSLRTSHNLPFDRATVWRWHTRPGAVVRLTPPFVPMVAIQQADDLADGLTRFALPAGLRWDARHVLADYQEGRQFADVCVSAPLKALANWRHVHTFTDTNDGGTRITDTVTTRMPAKAMTSLFAYRQHQLLNDLEAQARSRDYADPALVAEDGSIRPLTIAITGARGTIGTALKAQLTTAGHTVITLRRSTPKRRGQRHWDPNNPSPDLLDGVDALIHLAGEPLLGRFNDDHKAAIYDSRVGPTEKLAQLVADSPTCHTMVCASAIGYYGHDRGAEELTETSTTGDDFLAHVCRDWEAACEPARAAGKRVANIRTGIVLSARGGVLPVLRILFSAALGGQFGDGSAWFSWIAIDDLTDIYYRALLDPTLTGPINAVAPNPVQNKDMVKALAAQVNRPAVIPIPTLGPKLLLGEQGAEELALADQNVHPQALEQRHHHWRYPTIDTALAHELGGEELFEDHHK